ncbi:hypothetical protein Q5H92_14130 [Hymenobacter sp. M29]|uniref:Secretion system C-terminal sorting domain-containing protein n=2 Tax=Hymenobacter mellowenesis TaxID=3063995 RepID=A0ABT9ADQ8_9BACT|nr:hypothetical protein [Hymenobacter sp. M29]MDO7847504.1 hypothetical protein [Hymenobacter sp. M29]
MVRLLPSGAVDASFAAQPASLDVSSLVVQADGKVVVAGLFTEHNSQPVGGLLRLNADGTHDFAYTFNNGGGLGPQTFPPNLNLQADGKILVGGTFNTAGGLARNGLARFNDDGSLDSGFVPATAPTALVGAVAVQPDGRILVSDFNGGALVPNGTQKLVRLMATGAYDNTFTSPSLGVAPSFNAATTLLVQPNGRILFASQDGYVPPGYIVRLTSTGATDATWNVPISPSLSRSVGSLQLLPGGQVVFGGVPQPLGGALAVPAGVGQLTSSGAADASMPVPTLQVPGVVFDLALQTDGKVLVAGAFTEINGAAAQGLARLQATGAVDVAFTTAAAVTGGYPTKVKLQPDGKVLVIGSFNALGGVSVPSLGRVLSTGAPDPAFAPVLFASSALNLNSPANIELQADGKILLAGNMQLGSGSPFIRFLRLLPGGGLDTGFQPPASLWPAAMLVEPSGAIVVGSGGVLQRLLPSGAPDPVFVGPTGQGQSYFSISGLRRYPDCRLLTFGRFTALGGVPTVGVARLSSSGAVDASFVAVLPGTNYSVQSAELQPNGRVLVGGTFSTSGYPLQTLVRLLPDGSPDASLDITLNPNQAVLALAVQPNGGLLVGGQFTTVGSGAQHLGLVRLLDANVLSVPAAGLLARTETWPVPAHDQLHLRLDRAARPARLDLRDALGRTVLTQPVAANEQDISLPVAQLPAGVYFLQVHYLQGGTVVRRISVE